MKKGRVFILHVMKNFVGTRCCARVAERERRTLRGKES